jgi:hypothetical protein
LATARTHSAICFRSRAKWIRSARRWDTSRGLAGSLYWLGQTFHRTLIAPTALGVSAARTVLELALKGFELEDLAVRVEELELQVSRV